MKSDPKAKVEMPPGIFGIRTKLLLINSLVIAIALGGMIFAAGYFFQKRVQRIIQDYNLSLARLIGSRTGTELKYVADRSRAFIRMIRADPGSGSNTIQNFFKENQDILYVAYVQKKKGVNENIMQFYNETALASQNFDSTKLKNLSRMQEKSFSETMLIRETASNLSPVAGIPLIGISVPFPETSNKSFIVIYLLPDRILKDFRNKVHSSSFEFFIIGSDGGLILHKDSKISMSGMDLSSEPLVRTLLRSGSPNALRRYAYHGTEYLGAYQNIGFAGLGAASRIPTKLAFKAVYDIRRRNIIIMIIALSLSFMAIVIFASSLTVPILQLARAAGEIMAGNFHPKIQARSGDEVGMLTNSFIAMAHGLEERQSLRGEMEAARKMQSALLPNIKELGNYETSSLIIPAEDVGGDYFDLIESTSGESWAAIGDVSGHGLESGMIMIMAQTLIAHLIQEKGDRSPAEILHAVNRAIRRNTARMELLRYMTISLMRLLPDRIIAAGKHEHTILYRRDKQICEIVPSIGTWLGISDEPGNGFRDYEIPIARGDLILLYSDGITEARNPDDEMFREERLAQLLKKHHSESPESIRDHIIESVFSFQKVNPDDISIAILKRKDT